MKIFISHSTRNKEIVKEFVKFLTYSSGDIDVFCSSEFGSIGIGSDFVKRIFDEINACDLFIPIISKEYFVSRFCMVELGVAFSSLYNKYNATGEEYIFPLALPPVTADNALAGTPLANLQVGEINNENHIRDLMLLVADRGVELISGINRRIHGLSYSIDQILIRQQNIVELARINTYFDDSIEYMNRSDVATCSLMENVISVNFNMNPYERSDVKRPGFISLVLKYTDRLDLLRYLDFNEEAEISFVLNNFTNSLVRIHIEFKYSDNNNILETFEKSLKRGDNRITIPLKTVRSKALAMISEICFVIFAGDVVEDEGMFKISDVMVK